MNTFDIGVEEGMVKTAVTKSWVMTKFRGAAAPKNAADSALLGQRISKASNRLRRREGQLKSLDNFKNVSTKMNPRELKARSAKIENLKKRMPGWKAHYEGLQDLLPSI